MIILFLLLTSLTGDTTPWEGFPEADALRYEIDLTADIASEKVQLQVNYVFRADAALSQVRLHAKAGKDWQMSFQDSQGVDMSFTRSSEDVIAVELPSEVPAGQEFTFSAELSGTPPDGLYFRKNRQGKMVMFTDHFAARARGWLPCEDAPDDRAAFHLQLTVLPQPGVKQLDAIGTGDWHGEPLPTGQAAKGSQRWVGHTQADITSYLFSFAVGPYVRLAEKGDDRLIPHFVFRADKPKARRGLKHHADWMTWMEDRFGKYAWAKYCVVQVPTQWGGMENPGNTWAMERLFDGPDHGVGTLAHEFVHQWFGDAVGYGTWQDAWLSEGFATYFGPWLHELSGGPTLAAAMRAAKKGWLQARIARSRPIRWDGFENPDELFGTSAPNTYKKGAWVLHMLRGQMGDEAFFEGLRLYAERKKGLPAKTLDLRKACEEAHGSDLEWFFDQWLNRPGCPELYFDWSGSGVTVTQAQAVEAYRFDLCLSWKTADGSRHEGVFEVNADETVIELPADYRTPIVDPHGQLLWVKARLR